MTKEDLDEVRKLEYETGFLSGVDHVIASLKNNTHLVLVNEAMAKAWEIHDLRLKPPNETKNITSTENNHK